MAVNLASRVEAAFSTLMRAHNYEVIDRGTDASFGDAFVTLRGGNVVLRVVRDRGRLSAQCGPVLGDRLYGIEAVAEFLSTSFESAREVPDMDDIAVFALANHDALSEAFDPERLAATQDRLGHLERRMFQDRFGRPF